MGNVTPNNFIHKITFQHNIEMKLFLIGTLGFNNTLKYVSCDEEGEQKKIKKNVVRERIINNNMKIPRI